MDFLTAPLGSLGLLSIIYAFYIMANLSQRYGQVIRLPPYYRGLYVAMCLVGIAFVSHLLRDSIILTREQGPPLLNDAWFYLLAHYLPLVLAITLAVGVSWRYWSWLLKEQRE